MLGENERNAARAREAFDEALRLKKMAGDQDGIALALLCTGELAGYEGQFSQAAAALQESLALLREIGHQRSALRALKDLAWIEWVKANPGRALQRVAEGLAPSEAIDDPAAATDLLLLKCVLLSQDRIADARLPLAEAMKTDQPAEGAAPPQPLV